MLFCNDGDIVSSIYDFLDYTEIEFNKSRSVIMYAPRMFQAQPPQPQPQQQHNLLIDIMRLVRDALVVVNDFVDWRILESVINSLNTFISDEGMQHQPMA